MSKSNVRKMVVSSVMMAMAFVLSFIPLMQLPFEGKITLFSMLPICFVSVKFGIRWGLGTAFCYAWLQALQGGVFGWGLSPLVLAASLLLDFMLAFSVLGLSGLFRRRGRCGVCLGTALACVLRFLSHFLSGFLLWTELGSFEVLGMTFMHRPVLYSLVYNGIYMLPETILTVLGMFLLFSLPQLRTVVKPE